MLLVVFSEVFLYSCVIYFPFKVDLDAKIIFTHRLRHKNGTVPTCQSYKTKGAYR